MLDREEILETGVCNRGNKQDEKIWVRGIEIGEDMGCNTRRKQGPHESSGKKWIL